MTMLEKLANPVCHDKIRQKLVFLAWHKYKIREEDSQDIFQNTMATYFQVRDRYQEEENHHGILIGIFNNKCLEFIDRSVREQRNFSKYVKNPRAKGESSWLGTDAGAAAKSVLEEIINTEDRKHILNAISELRPEAKEMFKLLVEQGLGRQGLIRHYSINKNTLDTRLHVFRKELKNLLRKRGVAL